MKNATLVALSLALATTAHGELIAGWNISAAPGGAPLLAPTAAAGSVTMGLGASKSGRAIREPVISMSSRSPSWARATSIQSSRVAQPAAAA